MAGIKPKSNKPGREVTTAQQLSGLCKKAIQVKNDSTITLIAKMPSKSVEFSRRCYYRFSALIFSRTLRVLLSNMGFSERSRPDAFRKHFSIRFFYSVFIFGIDNLPVLEKTSADKRAHHCAKSTLKIYVIRI